MMRRVNSMRSLPLVLLARRQADVPPRRPLHIFDSYLSGTSADFIDSMYLNYKKDPNSVDPTWQQLFANAGLHNFEESMLNFPLRVATEGEDTDAIMSGPAVTQSLADCARLTWMIQAFADRGHLLANLDPLEFEAIEPTKRTPVRKYKENLKLDLESFGFSDADANRVVRVGFQDDVGGILDRRTPPMTIGELHAHLVKTYCGKIGFELTHIINEDQSRFLRENIESHRDLSNPVHRPFEVEKKRWVWDNLASAVMFEDFFLRKHGDQKRFGLDGGESLVVGLRALVQASADMGVTDIAIGMAHRGRLNILHHLCSKPFAAILKEFTGIKGSELAPFVMQSDVKYHLGASNPYTTTNGKVVHVEMLSNPSHLEAVNPFVQGKARAAQFSYGQDGQKRVLPIELHGDASFAGQGVVYETMGISECGPYHTGGTIHVVVNNQIGFTTDPKSSRSSAYCTDLGRTFQCPVFHVNGDSPEDVVRVFELAANFRREFQKSVVIDLVCYRRNGHNENDDPSMTQPLLYKRIRQHPNIFHRYSDELVAQKVVTAEEVKGLAAAMKKKYDGAIKEAAEFNYSKYLLDSIPGRWRHMKYSNEKGSLLDASVTKEQLAPVIQALKTIPADFQMHPRVKSIIDRRNEGLSKGENIEWGTAEALALGTLLNEGVHVRVSGQDVERATFSQRHAVFHHQGTNETYTQLCHISPKQAPLTITNSPLSEFGVLGFDSGYALHDPNALVMWEAQFGDFANGATTIFDQFLSSAETKWNQQNAVIVSMPHGYDGNGPEHSSGRIERFLQSVCEDVETPALSVHERHHRVNWEVTFPTTPAQYFHLLRRHIKRDFRKPLINFFSKQFLRMPNVSTLDEIINGSFQPVIGDASVPPSAARRVVLCTGQMYHHLQKRRVDSGNKDVAIVRVEQLSPFPVAEIQQLLQDYSNAELMWAQEEPKNMGAYWFVEPRIEFYTDGKRALLFNGRPESASPSTGFKSCHETEQDEIVTAAFA